MEQKPDNQLPVRKLAIGAGGGAFIGLIVGAVVANLLGSTLPWPAIGAGVGVPLGLGIIYTLWKN